MASSENLRCHKCKLSGASTPVYNTRAPSCGPCLEKKSMKSLHTRLQGAAIQKQRRCFIDLRYEPELVRYFVDKFSLNVIGDVTALECKIGDITTRSGVINANQRAQLLSQIMNGILARLGRDSVVINGRNANNRAGRIFERLLAGSLDPFDNYKDISVISIVEQLEDQEIKALKHHLFGETETSGEKIANNAHTLENVLGEFMHRIPLEMPSAISNVLATARKVAPASPMFTCVLCRCMFQSTRELGLWIPDSHINSENVDICNLCEIATRKCNLSFIISEIEKILKEYVLQL